MTGRPRALEQLDGYFAAGMIAHGYVANVHREVTALGQASAQTLALVYESAAIILEQMPALARGLRNLGREYATQELLDPIEADATRRKIGAVFARVEPELRALRKRQDEIAGTLRDQLDDARRG